MKKIIAVLLVSVLVLPLILSCVTKTNVTFYTDQEGADVYVGGEYIGKTPVTKNLGNGVWEEPDVLIKKEGHRDIHASLNKEIKPVNLIFGLFLWWPSLLWVYGPKPQQYYILNAAN